ncbi:hypothetical protein MHYP_G00010970 [Metynnis hypsauchen]
MQSGQMISSLKNYKGTFTQGPWSKAELQSTHRTDYKPYKQRSLKLYQPDPWTCPKPASPVLNNEPEIDHDTSERLSSFCKNMSNSVYGSSTFGQKGQSMIATLLERDKTLNTKGARGDQSTLPPLEKPTTSPLSQDVLSLPSGDNKLPSSSASVPCTPYSVRSSCLSLSRTQAASTVTPTVVLGTASSHCSPPCHRQAGRGVTSVKETMPVVKETVADTSRLLHIGSGQGSSAMLQEQGERQKDNSYENFLQDLCLSNKLERLLNCYFSSRSTHFGKGGMSQDNVTAYTNCFIAQKESMRHKLSCPVNKYSALRSPWVSEYADKFGFLQRVYPPCVPQDTAPPLASSHSTISGTLLTRRSLCTEYQASYSNKQIRSCRPVQCHNC